MVRPHGSRFSDEEWELVQRLKVAARPRSSPGISPAWVIVGFWLGFVLGAFLSAG